MATLWDRVSGNVGPWWFPWWGGIPSYIKDEGGLIAGLRFWWVDQVTSVWRPQLQRIFICSRKGHDVVGTYPNGNTICGRCLDGWRG